MRTSLSRLLACTFSLSFLTAAPAWSQAHETTSGAYTLRSSTVGSVMLSAESARKYGIDRSPLRGVFNATISKDGRNVPAKLEVVAGSLTGKTRPIPMTETTANDSVSYTGVYDYVHGEVLDFTVKAQPQGSNEALNLTFRDRMWGRGALPEIKSQP